VLSCVWCFVVTPGGTEGPEPDTSRARTRQGTDCREIGRIGADGRVERLDLSGSGAQGVEPPGPRDAFQLVFALVPELHS
jgi:hypothetical protein